jgi:predicted Zn-dependent protease
MTVTRMRRVLAPAALATLAVLLAGCPEIGPTGKRAFIPFSWEDEIALGREAAPELEKEFGGPIDDMALQAYVKTVGERIAASSYYPDLPYTFTALDSEVVNAFALPGGPVYVTRGLLEKMESEAELAAVLGHEVAHVTNRHSAQQIGRQMGFSVVLQVIGAIASRRGGGTGGEGIEKLGEVVAGLINLKYSRGMESEADRFGLDYLVAAGYRPAGMVGLLTTFTEMEGGRPPEFLSTHPNPDNRIGDVRQMIADKYATVGGVVNEAEYRRKVLSRL